MMGRILQAINSQPGMRTVQSDIDKALVKIHKDKQASTLLRVAERMLVFMRMDKLSILIRLFRCR